MVIAQRSQFLPIPRLTLQSTNTQSNSDVFSLQYASLYSTRSIVDGWRSGFHTTQDVRLSVKKRNQSFLDLFKREFELNTHKPKTQLEFRQESYSYVVVNINGDSPAHYLRHYSLFQYLVYQHARCIASRSALPCFDYCLLSSSHIWNQWHEELYSGRRRSYALTV